MEGNVREVVGVHVPRDRLEVLDGLAHACEVHLHRALAVDRGELLVRLEKVGFVHAPVALIGRELDERGMFVDEHGDCARALGCLAGVAAGVQRGVGRDHERRPAAVAPRANPVVGVVDRLGARHAGELSLALVCMPEVAVEHLFETAGDVGRHRFGVVEGGFGGDVDPADVAWGEPLTIHEPLGGVCAHGDDVLVNVGKRGGLEADSLAVLVRVFVFCGGERARQIEAERAGLDLDRVDADGSHTA